MKSKRQARKPKRTKTLALSLKPSDFPEKIEVEDAQISGIQMSFGNSGPIFDKLLVGLGLGILGFYVVMPYSSFLGLSLISIAFFFLASVLGSE